MGIRLLATNLVLAAAIFLSGVALAEQPAKLTDAEVKEQVIADSISAYPGNCPCPYNRASNGSRCGGRSAWSRAGGYSPVCFDNDVTQEMIGAWRARRNVR